MDQGEAKIRQQHNELVNMLNEDIAELKEKIMA
jgi:hypothetical protein